MSTLFRPPAEPFKPGPESELNKEGAETIAEDIEPLEERESREGDIVLESLEINEDVRNLPLEDQENVKEVKSYIKDIIKSRGLQETIGVFKKTLQEIKEEMGLDGDSDPSIVLDRIGGVVKAWKSLSFLPAEERKRAFLELSLMGSSKEMNRYVFEKMNDKKIWR